MEAFNYSEFQLHSILPMLHTLQHGIVYRCTLVHYMIRLTGEYWTSMYICTQFQMEANTMWRFERN